MAPFDGKDERPGARPAVLIIAAAGDDPSYGLPGVSMRPRELPHDSDALNASSGVLQSFQAAHYYGACPS